MGTTSFSLVKSYMDCVSEEGEAALLYFADLHWRGVGAHIASVLTPAIWHWILWAAEQIANAGVFDPVECVDWRGSLPASPVARVSRISLWNVPDSFGLRALC